MTGEYCSIGNMAGLGRSDNVFAREKSSQPEILAGQACNRRAKLRCSSALEKVGRMTW